MRNVAQHLLYDTPVVQLLVLWQQILYALLDIGQKP